MLLCVDEQFSGKLKPTNLLTTWSPKATVEWFSPALILTSPVQEYNEGCANVSSLHFGQNKMYTVNSSHSENLLAVPPPRLTHRS